MPICQRCQNTWTWKQTLRKTLTLYPDITCPYCEQTQYQTQKSRNQSYLFNLIILSPLLLNLFTDIHGAIVLSLFPILFVIIMLIYPYFVTLSNEDPFI